MGVDAIMSKHHSNQETKGRYTRTMELEHEGCIVFGHLQVSRTSGKLHIGPSSSRHSFDFSKVNISHEVDHLSFGHPLSSQERLALPEEVYNRLSPLDLERFVITEGHTSAEHYLKVVHTSFEALDKDAVRTYQFSSTSNINKVEVLPSVSFSYDLSALEVHITQTKMVLSEFLISCCAIIGGVFSVFGIMDATLYH